MRLESIRLQNFKAFRKVEMTDIPGLCVLVGANGSGKTTFFDVFGFLRDCLTYNVTRALESRGGFAEVLSRGVSEEAIVMELQCRLPGAGAEQLVTYHLEIQQEGGKPLVARETLSCQRDAADAPRHVLDFSRGSGYAALKEEDSCEADESPEQPSITEQTFDTQGAAIDAAISQGYEVKVPFQADQPDILAIKGLGQFRGLRAASAFRQLIENWHLSNFDLGLARGSKEAAGHSYHLTPSGDNLPRVAHWLHEHEPDVFAKIIEHMQRRVPGLGDIRPEKTSDSQVRLWFKEAPFDAPFADRHISDGTIKMFAYLLLLHDPAPHPLLCVEEPENHLHPRLLWELAEEFRAYAVLAPGSQVFVSTHSPSFLNALQADEVYWLVKQDGYTQVVRASDNEQIVAYMDDGDQMGYLWEQGLFPGADP